MGVWWRIKRRGKASVGSLCPTTALTSSPPVAAVHLRLPTHFQRGTMFVPDKSVKNNRQGAGALWGHGGGVGRERQSSGKTCTCQTSRPIWAAGGCARCPNCQQQQQEAAAAIFPRITDDCKCISRAKVPPPLTLHPPRAPKINNNPELYFHFNPHGGDLKL